MNYVEQAVRLYVYKWQQPNQTVLDYYNTFTAHCDIIDLHGGQAGYHQKLYDEHLNRIKDEHNGPGQLTMVMDKMKEKAVLDSCDEFNAALFLVWRSEGRPG
jgi:hypothetical protein